MNDKWYKTDVPLTNLRYTGKYSNKQGSQFAGSKKFRINPLGFQQILNEWIALLDASKVRNPSIK